jgi:prepilin-type processing-associated H-X9-DG protein
MIAIGDANLAFVNWGPTEAFPIPLPQTFVAGLGVLWKDWRFDLINPDPGAEGRKAVRQRHRDRYNIAFCDGHIEALLHDQLYDASDSARRRWNRDNQP